MGVGAGVGAALRSGWRRAGRRAGAWCVGVGLLAGKLKSAGGAVVVGARLPELLVSRSTSRGLDWFGLVWTGLDWFGLVWTGLDWFGLVWTGLDWTRVADGSAREVSLRIIRIFPNPDFGHPITTHGLLSIALRGFPSGTSGISSIGQTPKVVTVAYAANPRNPRDRVAGLRAIAETTAAAPEVRGLLDAHRVAQHVEARSGCRRLSSGTGPARSPPLPGRLREPADQAHREAA